VTDAITTGVFGTLILVAIGYLVNRVDRMSDRLERLEEKVQDLAERVSRIEGRLDEREHHGG
jgi:prefoldin subunit 5